MAFCPNCGAEAVGKFCAKCGAAMPQGAPAPPPPGPQNPGYPPPGGGQQYQQQPPNPGGYPPPPGAAAQPAGLEENMACALCYLLGILTGVLFLVLTPYNQNRNVRFHAFQSIFVWVAAVVCFIAASILSLILLPIPFLGVILSPILHLGLGLGMFILWLMLMYKAYNRERWVLPIIGPLAEKQA